MKRTKLADFKKEALENPKVKKNTILWPQHTTFENNLLL